MYKWPIERKIKYEADADPHFAGQITSMPGGEKLFGCIQCGTCSATCPLSIYMDYTPRRVIAMTRAGFKNDVLGCFTIWLCASCYSCTVECPKQIKITDIMYVLKQRAIQDKVYRQRFPIPALAREFFGAVQKRGRNSESWVLSRLYLKTNPLQFLKQGILGMRLWLRGRMTLRPESIRDRRQLQTLLHAVEKGDRESEKKPAVGTGAGS